MGGVLAAGSVELATADRISPKLKVDRELYRSGEEVRLTGLQFGSRNTVKYEIIGIDDSCKEDQKVFEGELKANGRGRFYDQIIYMVQWDDCGEYEVSAEDSGGREARTVIFRVKGPGTPPPPPDAAPPT